MTYFDKATGVIAHQVSNDKAFSWRNLELLHASLYKLEDGNLGAFRLGSVWVLDLEGVGWLEGVVDDEQRIAGSKEIP